MEEENLALNENVEAENDIAATPAEEQEAAEETEEVETESADEVETESEETEKDSKKGFSNRVRELNARAKEAEEKAQSLAEKLAEMTNQPRGEDRSQPVDDSPLVQPGEEIDAAELDRRLRQREARILQRADSLVQLRGKQQEAINRINKEADEVMKLYPELNPDNKESFNKELSDAITEATEAFVLKNPYSASITNFVGKMMRPYKGAVSKGVGEATENIAKQVSAAALRPTAVRKEEKPATEKSIAELESELGVIQA